MVDYIVDTKCYGPNMHPCRFCNWNVCGCKTCQSYCDCEGYYEYYIVPYEKEVAKEQI